MDADMRELAAVEAARLAYEAGWQQAIKASARCAQVHMLGMARDRSDRVVAKILALPCPTPSGRGPIGETDSQA